MTSPVTSTATSPVTKVQRERPGTRVAVAFAHDELEGVFTDAAQGGARPQDPLHVVGREVVANAEHEDMYAAIDLLADKLDRMLVKEKKKMIDQHRRGGNPVRDGEFG